MPAGRRARDRTFGAPYCGTRRQLPGRIEHPGEGRRTAEFETQVVETPTSCWTRGVDRGGLLALDRGQVVAGGADVGPATDFRVGVGYPARPGSRWNPTSASAGGDRTREDSRGDPHHHDAYRVGRNLRASSHDPG